MNCIDGAFVWKLHATHGLPIEESIPVIADEGLMVSWLELLMAAHKDGALWEVLIPRICGCVRESSWPLEAKDEICKKLQAIADELVPTVGLKPTLHRYEGCRPSGNLSRA